MNVLVTGATGFVGAAIARRLAADPAAFVVAAGRRASSGFGEPNVVPLALDVTSAEAFAAASEHGPFDAVVHAAGLAHRFAGAPPDQFESVNVRGAMHAARYAARVGARLVHISSVSVYGDHGPREVDETAECRPSDPYGRSKLAAERAVAEAYGGDAWVLRLATVVGPGDPGNLARLITANIRRRFVQVGPGRNRKTFVSVDDVADIAAAIVSSDVPAGGTYNVAAAPVTVGEVVGAIRVALGRKERGFRLPMAPFSAAAWLNRRTLGIRSVEDAARMLAKWTSDDVYSGEKLRAERGLAPKREILEEIARETRAIAGLE